MIGWSKWLSKNLMLVFTLSGVILGAILGNLPIFILFIFTHSFMQVILGFSLRSLQPLENTIVIISYPGELFMRLLKLLILPLIISSLIAGSASLNAKLNGKIAGRTLIYFLITSILNTVLGVTLVLMIHPGDSHLKMKSGDVSPQRETSSMVDSLLDLGRFH